MNNREDVIKVLECCAESTCCEECPAYDFCYGQEWVVENALALCRDLTEENERLARDKSYWKKRAESRELEHDKAVKKGYSWGKADTIRRMHKIIGERCIEGGIYPSFVAHTITEVAEELLEETE